MLRLHESNRSARLLDILAAVLEREARGGAGVLTPTTIVVPNRAMERFIEQGLARRLGVAGHLLFPRLEAFLGGWLDRRLVAPDAAAETGLVDRTGLTRGLLRVLLDPLALADPALAPVAAWLDRAGPGPLGRDARVVELATMLAGLFEGYAFGRPALLAAWRRGAPDDAPPGSPAGWQAALWRRVHPEAHHPAGPDDDQPPGAAGAGGPPWSLPEALRRVAGLAPAAPGRAVHVFGFSYLPRSAHDALRVLGRDETVHVYTPNPCRQFWEDAVPIGREDELPPDDEHPLLGRWGRPGREHLRQLSDDVEAVGGTDDDAGFEPPDEGTLLGRVQGDLLDRRRPGAGPRPHPGGPTSGDDSLAFWSCPSPRREAEAVAAAIWQAVAAPPGGQTPLRFHEVAVLYPGVEAAADRLPHLEAAFAEAPGLPYHVIDLPLAARSRVVEAALRLIALPLGRGTRPELLEVLLHPVVRPEGVRREDWVGLVDDLGVLRGFDADDLAGTVLAAPDRASWGQAARRLALGQLAPRGDAADADPPLADAPEPAAESLLAAPQPAPRDARPETLGLMIRSLAADVRRLRETRASLADWAVTLGALLSGYLGPRGEGGALRRCLEAAASLADLDPGDGREVAYGTAAELLRRGIEALPGERGLHLATGVTVATMQPMRSLPFRRIFVLGLDGGAFPGPAHPPALDLRGEGPRALGDVTPRERDLYAFLETLVAAREQLVVSWVGRDPTSGEAVSPAGAVVELLEVARETAPDGEVTVREVPMHRDDDPAWRAVSPAARRERAARALGVLVAEDGDDATALPDGLRARVDALLERPDLPPDGEGVFSAVETEGGRADAGDDVVDDDQGDAVPVVSASVLRAFLECPLQGWARLVLSGTGGQPDPAGEDAARHHRENEPYAPTLLDETRILREAFLAGQRSRRGMPEAPGTTDPRPPAAEALDRRVAALASASRWPPGVLGDRAAAQGHRVLDHWHGVLGVGPPLSVVRIGESRRRLDADRRLPALSLTLGAGEGRPTRRCRLVGTTLPFREQGGALASHVLRPRPVGGSGRARGVSLRRLGLRGWLDHLMLAALGETADLPRFVHVVAASDGPGRPPALATLKLAPVSRVEAHALLGQLLEDLALGPPPRHRLPCEGFFAAAMDAGRAAAEPGTVRRAIADLDGGGSCRFGPLWEAGTAPLPPDPVIQAVLDRRIGPYLIRLEVVEERARRGG